MGNPQHFRWLRGIVAVVLVLNALDGILTLLWIFTHRATEANPLMAELLSLHPVLFMVGKLSLVTFGTVLLWRLRRRAGAVVALFMVFLVYYFLLLYHLQALNLRLVSRLWGA